MSRASLGRGRRVLFVSAAAAALVAAAGGIAYSAIPSAGVIHACYLNGVGSLRVIDTSAGQRCRRNETAIFWDQHGTAGPVGPTGPAGPVGATGATGQSGPAGATGTAGARGATGAAGATGTSGVAGATGPAGPAGPTGLVGPAGATGPAGPQGIQGLVGPPGATGLQGLIGPSGPAGPQGTAGSRGAKGDTGDTGPQGSAGPKGDTGETGATGATGPQGPAGPPGPSGSGGGGSGTDAYAGHNSGITAVDESGAEPVSVDLPDGSWVISAKAGFSAASPTTLVCSLVAHSSGGDLTLDSTTVDADSALRGLSLLATPTIAESMPVALSCATSSGGSAAVTDVQLVAVHVSSLVVTDAGGGF